MDNSFTSRREFLVRSGTGLAVLALTGLLERDGILTCPGGAADLNDVNPLAPKPPHLTAKAKRVIHLFMNGGPSQVDTFDPKPILAKYDGKNLPIHFKTSSQTGTAFPSPFTFQKYGQSGLEISELFSHLGAHADDLCVIRSMVTDSPNHNLSLMMMNCGDNVLMRPSIGSWITYGLGSENEDLPGFVAMCPGGYPIEGVNNWRSAFLPSVFQGTYISTQDTTKIEKLIDNIRPHDGNFIQQRRMLDLVQEFNRHHQGDERDAGFDAQIRNYELAYRMQTSAAEVFDLSQEPKHVIEMYGDTPQAKQILIARRLVERGVRYVQCWHGPTQPWDNHNDLPRLHRKVAGECSQAISALLTDLKQRGLFDETLVLWGGEFGRTPAVEHTEVPGAAKPNGRDHNHYGFSVWLAGGGVKGGLAYGATDDFGWKAIDKPVHVHDLHATILHLMGLDHKQLTYRYASRDFRLTDIYGNVVHDIIA